MFPLISLIPLLLGFTLKEPSPDVPKVKVSYIEDLKESSSDTMYIVNFFATWCKPCVEELPSFEKLGRNYRNKPVKIILVSLDFPKQYASHLLPFVERENLKSKVVFLDEKDPNNYIPKVSNQWQGSIPATLFIYSPGKTEIFRETTFSYIDLKSQVDQILNL